MLPKTSQWSRDDDGNGLQVSGFSASSTSAASTSSTSKPAPTTMALEAVGIVEAEILAFDDADRAGAARARIIGPI